MDRLTMEYALVIKHKVDVARLLENNPPEVVKRVAPKEYDWYLGHTKRYGKEEQV